MRFAKCKHIVSFRVCRIICSSKFVKRGILSSHCFYRSVC